MEPIVFRRKGGSVVFGILAYLMVALVLVPGCALVIGGLVYFALDALDAGGLARPVAIAAGILSAGVAVAFLGRDFLSRASITVRFEADAIEVGSAFRRDRKWWYDSLAVVQMIDPSAEAAPPVVRLVDENGRSRKVPPIATFEEWRAALIRSAGPVFVERTRERLRAGERLVWREPLAQHTARLLLGCLVLAIGLAASGLAVLRGLAGAGWNWRLFLAIVLLGPIGGGMIRRARAAGRGLVLEAGGIAGRSEAAPTPWAEIAVVGGDGGLRLRSPDGREHRVSDEAENVVFLPLLVERMARP